VILVTDYKYKVENEKNEIKEDFEIDKDLLQSLVINSVVNEADTLKKAWFKHVLLNIEKLYLVIEDVKKEGIINFQALSTDIQVLADQVSKKIDKSSETTIITPNLGVNKKEPTNKFLEKISITSIGILCAILSGFVGGGIMILIMLGLKEVVSK